MSSDHMPVLNVFNEECIKKAKMRNKGTKVVNETRSQVRLKVV